MAPTGGVLLLLLPKSTCECAVLSSSLSCQLQCASRVLLLHMGERLCTLPPCALYIYIYTYFFFIVPTPPRFTGSQVTAPFGG